MTNRSSLGIDKALTRFATLSRNPMEAYAWNKVFPVIPVSGRTGKFYSFSNGFRRAAIDLKRGSGSAFKRFTTDVSLTDAYTLEESGAEFPVDDVDAQFASDDSVSLREAAAALATAELMIDLEREMAGFMVAGTITQNETLAAGSRWDDSGVDPRDDIREWSQTIQKSHGIPRSQLTLLINRETADVLVSNEALMQFFRSQVPGITSMTQEQLAQSLRIKSVVISDAVGNTAAEGATATNNYVFGKSAVLYYQETDPVPMNPRGFGFTFQARQRMRPDGRGGAVSGAFAIERYREEPRSEVVLASVLQDMAVTNATAAYLGLTVIN